MSSNKPRNPLRSPSNMFEECAGNTVLARHNPETGEFDSHTLEMLHADLDNINLNRSVPISVVDQFDMAKNLCLYGWYQYTFSMPAMLYSNIAVEVALREKYTATTGEKPDKIGLYKLTHWAVDEGFIKDGGFSHLFYQDEESGELFPRHRQDLTPEGTTYAKEVFSNTYLRNTLAHGSSMLVPPFAVVGSLRVVADAINQLFPQE